MTRSTRSGKTIDEFLGSASIFASVLDDVVERGVLEQVAGRELTLPQFRLLRAIAMADAQTITDVALFLGVSRAAASKAVDRLVRRSLLRRAEGEPDRRRILVSLTPSAERLLALYEDRKRQQLTTIFRGVPEKVLARTAYVLDRLSADLVARSKHPDEVCLRCGIYFRERCLVRQLARRSCFYLRNRHGPHAAPRPAGNGAVAAHGKHRRL